MRAAVVGAGIFGCTAAIEMAQAGFEVDLFERRESILLAASRGNQGRLHGGFHYPRSLTTAREVRDAAPVFAARFPAAVGSPGAHYYLVAKDSRTATEKYLAFCDELELRYTTVDRHRLVRSDTVDLIVRAESESFVDLVALRGVLRRELAANAVRVVLNTPVSPEGLTSGFDVVVDATYGRMGTRPLRFELTEIALVRLGQQYAGLSFVVMDGPFVSLDPLAGTDLHMLYDVDRSIHHVSDEYEVPDAWVNLVDRGVKHVSTTRVDGMLHGAREFLTAVGMPEYQGSLFTVRAVLPDVDETDERPTLVERDRNLITVLSGKIATAVTAGRRVVELAREATS